MQRIIYMLIINVTIIITIVIKCKRNNISTSLLVVRKLVEIFSPITVETKSMETMLVWEKIPSRWIAIGQAVICIVSLTANPCVVNYFQQWNWACFLLIKQWIGAKIATKHVCHGSKTTRVLIDYGVSIEQITSPRLDSFETWPDNNCACLVSTMILALVELLKSV